MATTKAKFNALQFLVPHEIDLQISGERRKKLAFHVCCEKICILTKKEEKWSSMALVKVTTKYYSIHALMKIASWFQAARSISAHWKLH